MLLRDVADAFGLGDVRGDAPEVRHGGVNVVTRLVTTSGAYAVHELLGRPPLEDVERILDLERTALAGGVPLAEPIGCGVVDGARGPVMVHRWVDAEPVDAGALPPTYPASLGRALGRLHAVAPVAASRDGLWWRDGREAFDVLDAWEAAADPALVLSHRDLTPANVLDLDGRAVLIDWESAGPIGRGADLGRAALDHALAGDELVAFLRGYATEAELPEVGHDWLTLWIRGVLIFEETCRQALLRGDGPATLRRVQQDVVATAASEVARRLAAADDLVARFQKAVRAL